MSERTSNETAAPVGPSGDVPSLLARAQEWLGCERYQDEPLVSNCWQHVPGQPKIADLTWPCSEATRLAALLADMLAEELNQPTKEQKMGKTTGPWTEHISAALSNAPTQIDPADIRPGDVVERRDVGTVSYISKHGPIRASIRPATWHLVHRPDPDAQAVEAMAVAEGSTTDTGIWQWRDFLTQLRAQGWDVVRRAES